MFGELYDRHAGSVLRYAVSRLGPEVGEDVASQTFLTAFEQRERFDVSRSEALPWLLGIATNLLGKHRRTEVRAYAAQSRLGADVQGAADQVRADEVLDAQRAAAAIAGPLRQLSPGDRDVLLLFAWADLSYEQIADALHVPVGTVRSRLNRARRVLRGATNPFDSKKEHGDGRSETAAALA